jgi:hypothetical protein
MTRLAVVALLLTSACTKVTYVNTLVRPTNIVVEHTGTFFLAGLVGNVEIDAYRDCPNGIVAGVQSSFSFVDMLLSVVTFDIYSPRTYAVQCGA